MAIMSCLPSIIIIIIVLGYVLSDPLTRGVITLGGSCQSSQYLTPYCSNSDLLQSGLTSYIHSAASYLKGHIYVTGGKPYSVSASDISPVNWLQIYDPFMNQTVAYKHSEMGTMNESRYLHTSVAVEDSGKLLICGGLDAGDRPKSSCEQFDVFTARWVNVQEMPLALHSQAAVLINGLMYIGGGITQGNQLSSAVFAYDDYQQTWTMKAPMPSIRAGHFGTLLPNQKHWLICGGQSLNGTQISDSCALYDSDQDRWSHSVSMQRPRQYARMLLFRDELFIIGGYERYLHGELNSLELYDVSAQYCTLLRDTLLQPCAGFASVTNQ